MPRPKHSRVIENPPLMEGFKPFGLPLSDLEREVLLFEEYEAIRLSDYEFLTQEQAARQMGISRPTFTRVYEKARRVIATAFVEGKAIYIEGGNYHTDQYWYRCENCRKINVTEEQISSCNYCGGEILKVLYSPETIICNDMYCTCTRCGMKIPHAKGKPCCETVCPSCSGRMIRENGYHHKLIHKIKEEKIMKIAIPTKNNVVDDHFGHCEFYTIFTVDEEKNIIGTETLPSPQGCGCKSNIASELKDMGVMVMLAGSMGEGALKVLSNQGIKVFRGCKGNVNTLVESYLKGFILDSGIGCHHHGEEDHQCSHHN